MTKITIEFGGFYGSIHESLVDSAVEMMCENDEGVTDEKLMEDFDFIQAYKDYSVAYLDKLSDFIADEWEIEAPRMEFIELDSPRFYNFSTDKIVAWISDEDIARIVVAIEDDVDFLEYVEARTKSGPGFISFYTVDEALDNKDGVLIEYIMAFIANVYNDEELLCGINEVNVFEAIL